MHLEIRIAELNVEIVHLKQAITLHQADNRRDVESLRTDLNGNTREILQRIDEIQIYLRNRR